MSVPGLLAGLVVLMSVHLFTVFRRSKQCKTYVAFYLSCAGVVILSRFLFETSTLSFTEIALIILGPVLNSLSYKHYAKFAAFVGTLRSRTGWGIDGSVLV